MRVSQYQKGKTNLDFTEARDSEWQWHQLGHMQVCISLQTDNHASTPPLLPPNRQRQSTEGISTEGIVGNVQVCSCRMIFVAVSNTVPYLLSDCDCFIKNADCCCIGRCPTLRRWGSQWWLQCRNYQYQLFSQAVMYWFSHRLAQVNSSRNRCSLLFIIITSRNAGNRQTTRITFTWVLLHIFGLF